MGEWMATAGLDVLEEKKISCSYRDKKPGPPSQWFNLCTDFGTLAI
jgi:hypothetical protein